MSGSIFLVGTMNSKTIASPAPAPIEPAGVSLSITGTTASWSFIDQASDEGHFELEKTVDGGVTWTSVDNNIAALTGTGLVASSTFAVSADQVVQIRAKAVNASGSSAWMPSAARRSVASAPSIALAAPETATSVALTISGISTVGVTLRVQRKTGAGGTYADLPNGVIALAGDGANINLVDATVAASTGYFYRARVENPAGNSSYTADLPATTPSSGVVNPTVVNALLTKNVGAGSVTLNYNAGSSTESVKEDFYQNGILLVGQTVVRDVAPLATGYGRTVSGFTTGDVIRVDLTPYSADGGAGVTGSVTQITVTLTTPTWPDNDPSDGTWHDIVVMQMAASVAAGSPVHSDKLYIPSPTTVGADWSNDARVFSVVDASARYGYAIQKMFLAGEAAGWHGLISKTSWPGGGAVNELYFRIIYEFSPNWSHHSGGEKLIYFGAANGGSATEFIIGHRGGGGQLWFVNQYGNSQVNATYISDNSLGSHGTKGVYHSVEAHLVGQSAVGVADGAFTMWHNDNMVLSLSGKKWVPDSASNPNFNGIESFLFWGGSGSQTVPADMWIRLSELYIRGK